MKINVPLVLYRPEEVDESVVFVQCNNKSKHKYQSQLVKSNTRRKQLKLTECFLRQKKREKKRKQKREK